MVGDTCLMRRVLFGPRLVGLNAAFAIRRMLMLCSLCVVCACSAQPAVKPQPSLLPSTAAPSSTLDAIPAVTPAAVIDKSQLLASGIRIEEHPLVRRPEIEPLILEALDGQNEVELFRRHASELHQSLRPESYYGVSAGSLWAMQGSSKLQTAEFGGADVSAVVTRDGQPFFSVPNASPGVTSPFRVLAVYGDHWVLELAQRAQSPDGSTFFSGRVFVDGLSLDDQYGYQESFGFQTMAGRPFYFFRRGGQVGVVVDGQEVPLGYDDVPHYGCCSAGALNPRMARNMLAFFARRGERWYYVEIGAFDEDR